MNTEARAAAVVCQELIEFPNKALHSRVWQPHSKETPIQLSQLTFDGPVYPTQRQQIILYPHETVLQDRKRRADAADPKGNSWPELLVQEKG
jgi:hypothetical protein